MAELNVVDTGPGAIQGKIVTPYMQTRAPGYSFGDGNGYLEFGTGTSGSLPFRVDQNGVVTASGIVASGATAWVNVKAAPYGAKGNGTADDTAAVNAAIAAVIAAGSGTVYLPAGQYKVTSDLLIQSVTGFAFIGDGREATKLIASGSGFTTAVVNIDGSAFGRFGGFSVLGDGTESAAGSPIPNGVNMTWTTGAARSTTGNVMFEIYVRTLNFASGITNAAPAGTTRQVDGTTLRDCVVTGGGSASYSFTTAWLVGFQFGNGTSGNQYNFEAYNCYGGGLQNQVRVSASGIGWFGGEPAANAIDFRLDTSTAQVTIQNVQSQQSGMFLYGSGGSASVRVGVRDCMFVSTIVPASNLWIEILGGAAGYTFDNVQQVNASATYVPVVYINGTGSTEVATFINLKQANTLALGITGTGSTPALTAVNYTQTNSAAQVVAVTPFAQNTTASWVTVT